MMLCHNGAGPTVFSPKGWESSAPGTALGQRPGSMRISPKDWERLSQPFGLG